MRYNFSCRGQSFKDNALTSNQNGQGIDDAMLDDIQGEITESIGGLYEIQEPVETENIIKKLVSYLWVQTPLNIYSVYFLL